jgi:hypothetical protein
MIRPARFAIVVVAALLFAPAALAQNAPEGEDGRYTFTRVGENYFRLDTRTGHVSACSRRAVGWACVAVPDERAVLEAEIARIQTENGALKRQLLVNNIALPDGVRGEPVQPKADEPRLRLPNDQDINTVMSFIGRMWRRLVDAMAGLQNDVMRKS